jgi:hypothetical protein
MAALVVLAALAAAPAADARHDSSGPVGDDAAKRKAKKCRKGLVRVKVGKRVTCRPLKQAFPKPRAGDPRKLFAQFIFKKDFSHFRNRRGKRPKSLPKLIKKTGRTGPKVLAQAMTEALARLDRMKTASARAAQSSSGCSGSGPRTSDSFTSGGGGGGPSATVGVTLGPDGGSVGIDVSGNGTSVKVDMGLGLCDPNELEAPDCPTAAGKLEGKIRYKFKAAITVTQNGTNVWSQSMTVTRTTKLVGWNDVDAHLDRLDVDDVETSLFTLGGATRGFPPTTIKTKLERTTQVDMRSRTYEPNLSNVEVTITMEGLFGPDRDEAESDAERRARSDAMSQFRSVVEKGISGYATREDAWQDPPKCATLEFQPGSRSMTLRPNDAGSFTAKAKAKSDGQFSELDAKLTTQHNAVFTPTRAGGQQARFSYTVNDGARDNVSTTVRATSRAGVAEGTWEQQVQPPPPPPPSAYNGTFTGTADYDEHELGQSNNMHAHWSGGFHANWSGPSSPGTSDANYSFSTGSVQYTYSGHVGGCHVAGEGTIDLGSQPDFQNFPLLRLDFASPPRKYNLQVPAPLFAKVVGTRSDCDDPNDNGKDFDWSPAAGVPWFAYAPYPAGPVGDDWSIAGTGSGNTGDGSPDQSWGWQLTPVP